MIIISYLNEGKPVFSLAEEKDIDMIVGMLFKDYIGTDKVSAEKFSDKKISFDSEQLKFDSFSVKHEIIDGDPLATFEKTASLYGDVAYFFDGYACYEVVNGNYKELDSSSYELVVCETCGKTVFKKDAVDNYCVDCFLETGIKDIFQNVKDNTVEEYTEYEKISEVFNVVDSFKCKITKYLYINQVSAKAKEIAVGYLKKEKVPEKYITQMVGGFAA